MSANYSGRTVFVQGKCPLSLRSGVLSFKKLAFTAFKIRSLRGSDLSGSELKGSQGNALRQDFALLTECKNRVLIVDGYSGCLPKGRPLGSRASRSM